MCAVCLLNLHEELRCKPAAWVPVGWIPKLDKDLCTRPKTGFEALPSRTMDLFHQCFRLILAEIYVQGPLNITWPDGISRNSAIYLGGIIGDQQEADRVNCQFGVCHRCHVHSDDFLETTFAPPRTTSAMKKAVLDAAAGEHSNGRAVVTFDANGNRHAGPKVKGYDRVRKIAGAHLVQNAFWLVHGFCSYQMCMRDPMHQIDHGVIVFLLRAILWRYVETLEEAVPALAAGTVVEKLTARLNMVLGKREAVGQVFKGMHDTIMQISKTTRSAFKQLGSRLRKTPKLHSCIRCTDIRHLLLLLPLICHDLFSSEVSEHNAIPGNSYVEDPSREIVMVCIILLKWYHLYRSPDGHGTVDLAEMDRLARFFLEKCKEVFPYKNGIGCWIMGTDKVHFMIHAASEIMKWGSLINCSAETVETTHKTWVKEQGANTNQGPSAAKTMMKNSARKIASMELSQAVAGPGELIFLPYSFSLFLNASLYRSY